MIRILKEFLLAAMFLAAIFGAAMREFAPQALEQLLHVLGL